ncbi:MAG: hypothetical protein ABIG28_03650, partial [archaeon]
MPDMKHFKKKKRSKLLAFMVLLLSLTVLGGVVYLGFTYFFDKTEFSQQDVILSVSGDDTVQIGKEVTYRVRYGNSQSSALAKVVLEVRYPEGFVFSGASEEPTRENNIWELGSLDGLKSRFIDITGTLYGNVDEAQSFRVFLNYLPGNFSSEFQTVATKEVESSAAPVELNISAPKDAAPGINTEFTFSVKKSEETVNLPYLALFVEGIDAFNKKDSVPESDEFHEYRWTLGDLSEEQTVVLNGSFTEEEVKEQKIVVKLVGWKDESREGDGYVLIAKEHTISLSTTEVGLDVVVNGSRTDFTAQPGEIFSTSIVLKNNGENDLENIRTKITFEGPSYDNKSILHWAEIDDEADG